MRSLTEMVEGRSIADWWQTSAVLAMLANQHRDRKKRRQPYTAEEFHPHYAGKLRKRGGIPLTRDNIGMLKMFVRKKKPLQKKR